MRKHQTPVVSDVGRIRIIGKIVDFASLTLTFTSSPLPLFATTSPV